MASLGVGLYILSYVWSAVLLLVWVSIRTGLTFGRFCVAAAVILSVIICVLPKVEVEVTYSDKLYNKFHSVRYFALAVLVFGSLLGVSYTFLYTCHQPVEVGNIRRFGS